jgi:drug/metabolite transporter (DMT)-like permease
MRAAAAEPVADNAELMTRLGWPSIFVVLWASGYIAAKFTIGYAQPFTILLLRFAIVVAVMLPLAVLGRAPWPRDWRQVAHIAVV